MVARTYYCQMIKLSSLSLRLIGMVKVRGANVEDEKMLELSVVGEEVITGS